MLITDNGKLLNGNSETQLYLIVGLGNPGAKYKFTRHNVAWLCLDHCISKFEDEGVSGNDKSEHKAETWKAKINGIDVIVALPQTFMNLSGQSVQSLMAFYKVPLENILVLQDDLDLALGRIKFLKNRGAGGHNGIKNITELLGTPDFARLKIGVGGVRHPGQEGGDYVLQNFPQEEMKVLGSVFDRCSDAIKMFIDRGYERTANVYNQKNEKEDAADSSKKTEEK